MLNKTVAVAMSGGVDSSLAAILLKQQGFNVFGVTMKLWDYSDVGGGDSTSSCCNINLVENAKAVCAKFDIPHYVLDMTAEFRDIVIADFINEYSTGRTPNPCVVCNTKIKWQALLEKVRSMGAESLATGHYAQVEYYPKSERWILLRGIDQKRDQSYFLWGLTQDALANTVFPLGKMTKKRVRQLAKENQLRSADTPESREICFVTDDNYRRFLKDYGGLELSPGPFIDPEGKVVGEHQGVANYTVGQRRGLNIALGVPVYVKKIDPVKNEIHVATVADIQVSQFSTEPLNWVSIAEPDKELEVLLKVRYTQKNYKARLQVDDKQGGMVILAEPLAAVTPGQSAVFYNHDVVLAGGIIKEVY